MSANRCRNNSHLSVEYYAKNLIIDNKAKNKRLFYYEYLKSKCRTLTPILQKLILPGTTNL